MRRSRPPVWLAVALLVVASSGLLVWRTYRSGAGATSEIDDAASAPTFDLASIDGSRYRLSDFSGRVLLLEFWATWCGPCRLQEEILERLYREVRESGIEFLAVSLGESEEVVREFTEKHSFPYPVLLDPEETLGFSLEIYALPTVVIVDRKGRIRFVRPGVTDTETLRRELFAALHEKPRTASSGS